MIITLYVGAGSVWFGFACLTVLCLVTVVVLVMVMVMVPTMMTLVPVSACK